MAIDRPQFYPGLPNEGIQFFKQREKFRTNHNTLFAIASSSYQDGTPPDAALAALAYGEELTNNRRRFRLNYKKGAKVLTVQKNVGTDSNEDWVDRATIGSDRLRITDDGVITAQAFYAIGEGTELRALTVGESKFAGFIRESFSPVHTITFDRQSFYVEQAVGDPNEVIIGLAGGGGGGGSGGLQAIGTVDEFGDGADKSFASVARLRFDTDSGFYLFGDFCENPVVGFKNLSTASNLGLGEGLATPRIVDDLPFKSLVAGEGVELSSDFYEITINAPEKFYSTVKQTDDGASFSGIKVWNYNSEFFYITQNFANPDEAIINFRGDPNAEANTASNLPGDEGLAASKVGVDLQFKSLTAGTNIALSSDANEVVIRALTAADVAISKRVFTNTNEVQFNHNLNSKPLLWAVIDDADEAIIPNKVDFSNPDLAFFYFDSAISGEIILSTGIGPPVGFYLTAKHTDNSAVFGGLNTLNFNVAEFYLTQNFPNTDEVTINLRGAGAGQANTASNLGAGEGTFASKVGVDLRFKSLVAGTGVELSSDANEITINAPEKFYLTVKQTDDAVVFRDISLISFGEGFYLTQNDPNTDESIVNLRQIKGDTGDTGPAGAAGADGAGFYLTLAHSDDSQVFREIQVIKVNVEHFYLTQNDPNTDEALINFRGDVNAEQNTGSNLGAGEGVFESKVGVDLRFKSIVGGSNITLSSTATEITIDSQAGGEFYSTVKQTDGLASFSGIKVWNYNSEFFYITQNAGNTDEAIINFRGDVNAEQNTASNLGSGEGTFAQKIGVDLQFKSLVAGDGIELSSDGDEITLNAPEKFYATVKQSDGAASFSGIKVWTFNSETFYVTQNATNPDEATINLRGSGGAASTLFFNTNEVQFDHNLGVKPLLWAVYDNADEAVIPQKVDVSNLNTAFFYFSENISGSLIVSKGEGIGAGGGGGGGTTNRSVGIITFDAVPDGGGQVFLEPYDIKATNDVWKRLVLVFNDTASRKGFRGGFSIPADYVSGGEIVVTWTSTATSGDVEWDFDYRVVSVGDSFDQLGNTASLNTAGTAPSAAHERVDTILILDSGIQANDEIEFELFRDGTDGGDDMAAAAMVFRCTMRYTGN